MKFLQLKAFFVLLGLASVVQQSSQCWPFWKPKKATQSCPVIANEEKFDCYPGYNQNVTQSECVARGCCWDPIPNQNTTGPHNPDYPDSRYPIHTGIPSCYYPQGYPSYQYVEKSQTNYGWNASLTRNQTSHWPEDVGNVVIQVYFETKSRLHIKIIDGSSQRYEVPVPKMPPPGNAATDTDYDFAFNEGVGFSISRKATQEVLFNASVGSFIFSDQFMQLSARLSTDNVYGLGQHNDNFKRSFDWQLIPLFASLLYPDYGSHPFYLSMEKSHQSHGVFLFNSNAMDIFLQPTPAITYRVIGGILDFYFFLGPSPDNVIQQYTELIGRPVMPPYWSLGFHLSKYNYLSVNETRNVWLRNKNAGIPFDVQWNDIDYMDNYKIFTYNKVTFGTLPEFVQELHDNHMRYIAIIDSGVSEQPAGTYSTYDEGVEMDVYIKNSTLGYAEGKVWPEVAVFPDWTHPNTSLFWRNGYQELHNNIPYDGAWIDMDEPTTFTAGSLDGTCPESKYDFPPYVPAVEGGQLFSSTICMSSIQHDGVHYNLHNLYGFMKTNATYLAIKQILQKRPFVMSRSTFPGQGHYGTHWTGDVYSSWHDLKQSIPGLMNFNMFGIPMVGADVCGFRQNTTLELCERWTQLSVLYPFNRNHNENGNIDQDPYALGDEMIAVATSALTLRYTLLPFMYTQFYRAHVYGETVVRPLFFEFPEDENTYSIEDQFMWSSHLMALPVVDQNTFSINPYFPAGIWYLYPNISTINAITGANVKLDVPYDAVLMALRGGSILPTQTANQTTYASRLNKFGLLVALDQSGNANGELFWDDGDTSDTIENEQYSLISFSAQQNSLTSSVDKFNYGGDTEMLLGSVTIFGINAAPTQVTVNDIDQSSFTYDAQTKVLSVNDLSVPLENGFTVTWN